MIFGKRNKRHNRLHREYNGQGEATTARAAANAGSPAPVTADEFLKRIGVIPQSPQPAAVRDTTPQK
jgi:hypothetical protein